MPHAQWREEQEDKEEEDEEGASRSPQKELMEQAEFRGCETRSLV